MNNNEIINQIKESLDIADIIAERVKLRKTSRGFMGLCPFHHEDTPSFHVYTETQSYYCFGCHEAGDIFTYVMKTEGLSFPEALKVLADRAGIKLEKHTREDIDTYGVLDMAAKFFAGNLKGAQGTSARAYMSRRKLDESDIGRYSLGYSLNAWDSLTKFLRSRGITDKAITDAGLALTNKHGLYDRFRGRLIFPIRDITGKVIAFGGRLIDGDGAKYLNSPESAIYLKRKNLYMLDTARKAIREKSRSILVEGYMDALRLHKCGFTEAVASLGTSLTQEQAKLLARYSDRCYICYDSDTAGQDAAVKGMYILAENGLSVYVVSLPEGKDPDEFLCANPPESFEAALREAKPLIVKHLESVKPALNNELTRRKALDELFENLRRLDTDDVLQHMGSICDTTLLPSAVVEARLLGLRKAPEVQPLPQKTKAPAKNPDEELEAMMCALLLHSLESRVSLPLAEAMRIMNTELAQLTAAELLTENTEGLQNSWLMSGETDKVKLISRGEAACTTIKADNDAERFVKIYSALKRGSIDRRIAEIHAMPPNEQNPEEMMSLIKQRMLFHR